MESLGRRWACNHEPLARIHGFAGRGVRLIIGGFVPGPNYGCDQMYLVGEDLPEAGGNLEWTMHNPNLAKRRARQGARRSIRPNVCPQPTSLNATQVSNGQEKSRASDGGA